MFFIIVDSYCFEIIPLILELPHKSQSPLVVRSSGKQGFDERGSCLNEPSLTGVSRFRA